MQAFAEGAIETIENLMTMLADVFRNVPDLKELAELFVDLVENSAEWAGAMIEMATGTRVLSVLFMTMGGVILMTPPNFWAEAVGNLGGYLIPELIVAVILAVVALFTAGTGGGALAYRITVFVAKVTTKLAQAGKIGKIVLRVFSKLAGLADKIKDLVHALKRNIAEARRGTTDATTTIVRQSRTPRGRRTRIPENADDATRRSLVRENESADILAREGFDVEQNPIVDGPMNPDYRIDGAIYDNYAPSTGNPRNIWSEVEGKVSRGQTENIVLNLSDSNVDIGSLRQQFNDWPIDGLKEVKVITTDGYVGGL